MTKETPVIVFNFNKPQYMVWKKPDNTIIYVKVTPKKNEPLDKVEANMCSRCGEEHQTKECIYYWFGDVEQYSKETMTKLLAAEKEKDERKIKEQLDLEYEYNVGQDLVKELNSYH